MPPLLTIDHHNGVPAYRQIMDQIRFQIASGLLATGDELPSTRALSTQLSLNPMTISKAYSLLEHDGVLERRRGQNLVVRALPKSEQEANKLAPLRQHLSAASIMASQLGVPPAQALKIFRELLDHSSP
ncbi:MAG: GntR family transcriptional regulator [Opitutaceae bacterium]|jgi:GntR family transcriptional regulator